MGYFKTPDWDSVYEYRKLNKKHEKFAVKRDGFESAWITRMELKSILRSESNFTWKELRRMSFGEVLNVLANLGYQIHRSKITDLEAEIPYTWE